MICEKAMQKLSELAQNNAFILLSPHLKVFKVREVLIFHIIIFPALLGKKLSSSLVC